MRARLKVFSSFLVAIMVISLFSSAVFAAKPPAMTGEILNEFEWEYYDIDKTLVVKPTVYKYDNFVYVRLWLLNNEDVLSKINTLEINLSSISSFSGLVIYGSDLCTAENLKVTGAENCHIYYLRIDTLPYLEDEDNISFPTGFTCDIVQLNDLPFTIIPSMDYLDLDMMTLDKMYNMEAAYVPDYVGGLSGCSVLQEVTLYYGRETVNPWMFENDEALMSVLVPSSVTSIEYAAFYHCESLAELPLPDSVSVIAPRAFEYSGLQYFEIPENVSEIDFRTFYGCVDLETVYIPAGVDSIAADAFDRTDSLTDVYYEGTYEQFTDITVIQDSHEEYDPNLTMANYFPEYVTIHCADVPALKIVSDPEDFVGPVGSKATFSVEAEGEGLKYQWQYNSKGVWKDSGATGNKTSKLTVDITNARDGMKFRCVVTDKNGKKKYSDPATLHVGIALEITKQPVDFTGLIGNKAYFSIAAKGEDLEYQWQYYSKGVWKNSGATGNKTSKVTVDITSARDGMKFRCVVTDGYGHEEISDEAAIHLGTVLEIVEQPADYTGPLGSTASFFIAAEGDGLKYQWQYYSKGVWKNSGASGNKTPEITVDVTNARDGMKFRCVVTDCYGKEEISDEVTLHVGTAIVINEQPVDFTGPVGSTATFSIDAEGTDLTYQWQYYSKGVWKNSGASGNKTAEITVDITNARDGMKFRCVVTDGYGNEEISDEVAIHVGNVIVITKQPKDYNGYLGSKATFSIEAEGEGLSYQWQYYSKGTWKNTSASGATTPTVSFTIKESHAEMEYRCVVTDSEGNEKISDIVKVHLVVEVV